MPRQSLSNQCTRLSIPLSQLKLKRSNGSWQVGKKSYSRPEDAALANFQEEGWIGSSCEGGPALLAMKSAGFKWVVKNNTFNDEKDAIDRYLEAAIQISASKAEGFVKEVSKTSSFQYQWNFAKIYRSRFIRSNYPGLSLKFMRNFRKATGDQLTKIAEIFVTAPYDYRSGWPDLTIIRSGRVRFVEVKTTDKLHASQERLISNILKPVGADVSVLQIIPA